MRASDALNRFLDAVGTQPTGWASRVKLQAAEAMPRNPEAELILYRAALWGVYSILGDHLLWKVMKALEYLEQHRAVESEALVEAYRRLDMMAEEMDR